MRVRAWNKSGRGHLILGVVGIVTLLSAMTLSFMIYRGSFDSVVRVTVTSQRAGLMLESGSDVKVRDVVVGRVRDVQHDGQRAVISLDIDSDKAKTLPSNVVADIAPTTLFGRKFIALEWPAQPSASPIESGLVLAAKSVPTEVNDLLVSLVTVLDAVEPEKVNGSLNALATSLHGRGESLGDMLVSLDDYVEQFNTSLPTLQTDLTLGAAVTSRIAGATPDLIDTLANLTVTGDTVVERETDLAAFLLSFTEFGTAGADIGRAVDTPLVDSLRALTPTTALLAERAPTYPCFFSSLAQTNRLLERTIGGSAMPGLNVRATLLAGNPMYDGSRDLPIVGADGPAKCYDWNTPQPHTDFADGSNAYTRTFADLLRAPSIPAGGGE